MGNVLVEGDALAQLTSSLATDEPTHFKMLPVAVVLLALSSVFYSLSRYFAVINYFPISRFCSTQRSKLLSVILFRVRLSNETKCALFTAALRMLIYGIFSHSNPPLKASVKASGKFSTKHK